MASRVNLIRKYKPSGFCYQIRMTEMHPLSGQPAWDASWRHQWLCWVGRGHQSLAVTQDSISPWLPARTGLRDFPRGRRRNLNWLLEGGRVEQLTKCYGRHWPRRGIKWFFVQCSEVQVKSIAAFLLWRWLQLLLPGAGILSLRRGLFN